MATNSSAALFGGAQHVYIQGSQFHTSLVHSEGDSSPPPPPIQPQSNPAAPAGQQLPAIPPSRPSNILYQEQMLFKHRGHPLWFPQVSLSLPAEYRAKGFSIGDVGYFTPEGGFDFLFNIHLPINHPINGSESNVPEGFVPLSPLSERDIRDYWEFEPEAYLASSSVEISQVDMSGLTFASSASEGAILTMPHGAYKIELSNTAAYQGYVTQHAESWYKFANGPRGRNLDNGELRLVYGCDKSTSWGMATFSNVTYPSNFKLKFRKPQTTAGGTGGPISAYSWEHSGMADAMRVGPGVHDNEGLGDLGTTPRRNQCLFLRTMSVTLADDVWAALNPGAPARQKVETSSAHASGSGLSFPGAMAAAAAAVGAPFVFMLFKGFGGGAGMSSDNSETRENVLPSAEKPLTYGKSQDDGQRIFIEESDLMAAPHPATIINKILFYLHPSAKLAITTDAAWQDILPRNWKLMTIKSFIEKLQITEKAVFVEGVVHLDPLYDPQKPKTPAITHETFVEKTMYLPEGRTIYSEPTGSSSVPKGKRPAFLNRSPNQAYNDHDQACIKVLEAHNHLVSAVAFSPDGKQIASASWDSTIKLWDTGSGNLIKEFTSHTNYVTSVAFSADGKCLASGSHDKTIRIWNVKQGTAIGERLRGHANLVNAVAFSPTQENLLVSGSNDDTVRLWDVGTGKQVGEPLQGHTGNVYTVAFSLDGKLIASGSYDQTVRLWSVADKMPFGEPLRGHDNAVCGVVFSPDSSHLISSFWDSIIRCWNLETREYKTLRGHTSCVNSIAISKDGKRVVSGSDDKTVRFWDLETFKQIGAPLEGHTGYVYGVDISPDGRRIVSGSWDGTVRIWDAEWADLGTTSIGED